MQATAGEVLPGLGQELTGLGRVVGDFDIGRLLSSRSHSLPDVNS